MRPRPLTLAAVLAALLGALLAARSALDARDRPRKAPARDRRMPAAVALPPREGASPVQFVDATEESGVVFEQVNGYGGGGWFYVETLGSGVVFFDADGDGDADLFFCNGSTLAGPPPEHVPSDGFFRNDGRGRFVDATVEAGLADAHYTMAACAGDVDNDGDLDLYATNFDAPNVLYRNDGTGRFTNVAAATGAEGPSIGTEGACALADVDGDGWLDLFVGGCLDHSRARNKECFRGGGDAERVRRYCNPVDYSPQAGTLLRNRGDGTFEDATRAAGLAEIRARMLGVAFCDFDDDGDADLFVACDRTPNLLLVNDGRGRFREEAGTGGVDTDRDGRSLGGMGVGTGDWNGDGRLDLVATYFEAEANGLYRNDGDNVFTDCARPSGTANVSFYFLGWGTDLFDADLDGRLDWLVANGHVFPNIESIEVPQHNRGYAQLALFFLNRGDGYFESLGEDAGPALAQRLTARGLATADVDGDGDLDVAINSNHSRGSLWRNDSPRGDRHWLLVKTVGAMRPGAPAGSASNRDGVGARIVAHVGDRALVREVHTAQSYFSQGDLRAHFGLGAATRVDRLEIRWPSGRRTELSDVPADQALVVSEPD
jgi:hypothetical protein